MFFQKPCSLLWDLIPLFGQSENISRNNPDIVTLAMAVYVGPDQAARQASGMASGSPLGIEFLTQRSLPIQLLVNTVGDHLRYV